MPISIVVVIFLELLVVMKVTHCNIPWISSYIDKLTLLAEEGFRQHVKVEVKV